MQPIIDLDKEYGIVLEGGGAKGAYQVGAWQAMREAGVKIKGVAGTSVGALNGAMMCMDDPDRAVKVWSQLTYSQVMDVEDEKMQRLLSGNVPLWEAVGDMLRTMGEGGLDITPLKNLILEVVDEEKIRESPMELYIKTFSVDEFRELDIDIKEAEPELIKDYLLASAYVFPIFKNEKLHGKTYIDGGAINNVPLSSLIQRGYKDILVIRIFGIGREKKVKIPEDTTVYTVAPSVNLGNILDFNPKTSKRNMERGYFDTMRLIYGLAGKIYYIDEQEEECYYLKQLTELDSEIYAYLAEEFKLDTGENRKIRNLTEIILPVIADRLKLSKDWSYRELYLSMLEAAARLCRIQKYKIYTLKELQDKVKEKLQKFKGQQPAPFMQILSKDILL